MGTTLLKFLNRTEEYALAAILMAVTIILFTNVFLRYVFAAGFHWAEEFVRYGIMWMVFLGSSTVARRHEHLSVSAVTDRLSGNIKKVALSLTTLLTIGFCGFLAYYGYLLTSKIMTTGQLTPSLEIPKFLIYVSIPVAGVLMTLRYAIRLVQIWKSEEQQGGAQ